jgi:hypothetical protein
VSGTLRCYSFHSGITATQRVRQKPPDQAPAQVGKQFSNAELLSLQASMYK